MAFTGKQQRNGTDIGAGDQNTAQRGPDATGAVAAVKAAAESAALARKNEAAGLIQSPQGSGVTGHEVGAGGNMWEWDSGLAVNDVEGAGSG